MPEALSLVTWTASQRPSMITKAPACTLMTRMQPCSRGSMLQTDQIGQIAVIRLQPCRSRPVTPPPGNPIANPIATRTCRGDHHLRSAPPSLQQLRSRPCPGGIRSRHGDGNAVLGSVNPNPNRTVPHCQPQPQPHCTALPTPTRTAPVPHC